MKLQKNGILMLYLTLIAILLLQGVRAIAQEQKPKDVAKVTLTKIEWEKNFAKSNAVRRANNGVAVHPGELFAIGPPPGGSLAIARTFDVDHNPSNQLWIAQSNGKNAKLLATQVGRRIMEVQWSPDGKKLAYVTVEGHRDVDLHRDNYTRLSLVDVKTGHAIQIADNGALSPQWTPDGNSLLFWKRKAGDNSWQPFKADHLVEGKPIIQAVSKLTWSQPGAFSHDGLQVIGLHGDVIVESLVTHEHHTLSLGPNAGGRLTLQKIGWSWDNQWIYIQLEVQYFEGSENVSLALRLSDNEMLNLGQKMEPFVELKKDEFTNVTGGTWIPGRDHRLFIGVITQQFVNSTFPTTFKFVRRKWMIYDIDKNTAKEVDGIEPLHPLDRVITTRLSLNGRLLSIGNTLYSFDAPQ